MGWGGAGGVGVKILNSVLEVKYSSHFTGGWIVIMAIMMNKTSAYLAE